MVEISDGTSTVAGSVVTFTYAVGEVTTADFTTVPGVGTRLSARVIDECASAEGVSRAWPVNPDLAELLGAGPVCAEVRADTVSPVGCAILPLTGGARIYR